MVTRRTGRSWSPPAAPCPGVGRGERQLSTPPACGRRRDGAAGIADGAPMLSGSARRCCSTTHRLRGPHRDRRSAADRVRSVRVGGGCRHAPRWSPTREWPTRRVDASAGPVLSGRHRRGRQAVAAAPTRPGSGRRGGVPVTGPDPGRPRTPSLAGGGETDARAGPPGPASARWPAAARLAVAATGSAPGVASWSLPPRLSRCRPPGHGLARRAREQPGTRPSPGQGLARRRSLPGRRRCFPPSRSSPPSRPDRPARTATTRSRHRSPC